MHLELPIMMKSRNQPARLLRQRIITLVLPLPFLSIVLLFTYARFVEIPYLGFSYSGNLVTQVFQLSSQKGVQVGDILIKIGDVDMSPLPRETRTPLIRDVYAGDEVSIILDREGQILALDWIVPGPDLEQLLNRIIGPWWVSFVFWLAGTATMLFIRPRNASWILLVLINYCNAIFIIIGSSPTLYIWNSPTILIIANWFYFPMFLHLHWIYPQPFYRLPKWFWFLIYITSAFVAISQLIGFVSTRGNSIGFILAILGGILFLIIRWFYQKESRQDINLLIVSLTIIFALIIAGIFAPLLNFDVSSITSGTTLLALPLLPSAYFLVAYRQQFPILRKRFNRFARGYFAVIIITIIIVITIFSLNQHFYMPFQTIFYGIGVIFIIAISILTGFVPFLALPAISGETFSFGSGIGEIEIRANRLLSQFLFFILAGSVMVFSFILFTNLFSFTGSNLLAATLSLFLLGIITVILFSPFLHFVDRRLLGIKIDPREFLIHFSERITTSLERKKLRTLLQAEVFPSLLVRQSVLLLHESQGWLPFVTIGVKQSQIPQSESILQLKARVGEQFDPPQERINDLDWIRLVIPLVLSGETIGLWLFGRRDPDDYYAPREIRLLNSLANQIAIAVSNISQADRLRALYQSNIDRQEEEKKDLARILHDQVLGQIVALTLNPYSPKSEEYKSHFSKLTTEIRSMITNLRPAMLTYGLWRAVDELVDECSDRLQGNIQLIFDIPKSEVRYDQKAEEHFYRIIQQACENAMLHAQATTIRISGEFSEDQVAITIADDGSGFPFNLVDINSLVANHHFGLAGMYERAQLMDADFQIDTAPGNGTKITIKWNPKS